jgi:copper(I)-binding protein
MPIVPTRPIRSLATAALLPAALALAAGCAREPVRIEHAWVRAASVGGTTAAYFTLVNASSDTLHVTGVGGELAAAIQMHETVREGGMVTMREAAAFAVAPRTRLEFRPGGDHVMLERLRESLEAGARVRLALRLSGRADLPIVAEVRP